MTKSICFLIIAFIAFSCKHEQSHLKSDLKIANLKGNVWKIDRTIHDTENKCACALKTECNESKYVYDTKGNLLKSYTINEYGSINDSTNYIYKRSGVCTEIIKFTGNNSTGKEVPVFESGKVTGVQTYDENGKLETTLIYTYSGNEISEEKVINSNGEVVSIIQREFINGQIVTETEIDNNRNVISISKFKRNASNDITECLITVAKEKKEYKLMYEYEYDDAGNWIKQTKLYDNQIVNIVVRNIEYYTV